MEDDEVLCHLEPGRLRLCHGAEPAHPALGGLLLRRLGRLQELMALLLKGDSSQETRQLFIKC